MGPRGCSYLHFISIIKGGKVIKAPNISRVKTVSKFRNIEEFYVSIPYGGSSEKCPPKVERSLAIPYGGDDIKTVVKIEATEEENEPDFDLMTLKQLKKACKSKKRKTSMSPNWMDVKQEDTGSQLQEDEFDLKETLGSWKRKLLKKPKTKKSITKGVSLSFKTNSSGGRSKCIPHVEPLDETSGEVWKPVRIKVENAEFYYSQPQPITCVRPNNIESAPTEILGASEHRGPDQDIETPLGGFESASLSGTSDEHLSCPVSSLVEARSCRLNQASYEHLGSDLPMNPLLSVDSRSEDVEEVNDSFVTDDRSLDLPVVELSKDEAMADLVMCDEAAVRAQNCILSRVSYEHLECVQLQNPLISEDSKIEDAIEVDGEAGSGDKSLVSPVSEQGCEEGMSVPMTCDEVAVQAQTCVFSQVSYEHLEFVQLQHPLISEDSKAADAIEADGEAGSRDNSLVSPVSDGEQGCEEGMRVPVTCDEAPETVFFERNKSDLQGYNVHISCVQAPSTGPDRICQSIESIDADKPTCTIDNDDDIEAEVTEIVLVDQSSTLESTNVSPSAKNMVSRGNVASVVEEKQSPIHDVASALLTCPLDIQPCDSYDLLTGSSASKSCRDNVPRPPERLFSTRKAISPNSQERLCRVMNSFKMQEDSEIHPCREKLSFEKDIEDKTSSSKSDIKRRRITFTSKKHEAVSNTNTRPPMRKGKDERKGACFRGIPKGPHASNRCSSIQSCSQNAIVFSQQQMNDIERLAQKLVTEVQSMKYIFVDALQCESRAGAKLRYNSDEVRIAVENATKAEDTARKWLSMMTRDCNRFCKIMRLAETDGGSGSPEKAAAHKGRKIMFADEAGGSLCNVRVFETFEAGVGVASPVKCQIGEGH